MKKGFQMLNLAYRKVKKGTLLKVENQMMNLNLTKKLYPLNIL